MEEMTLAEILKEPQTLEDLNIPVNIVIDILMRLMFSEGNVTFRRLSQVMRIPLVLETLMDWMRKESLVDVMKDSGGLGSFSSVYKLTENGIERARNALERSQYVGPVPVPVHYYNRAIELQTSESRKITVEMMKDALKEMVLPDDFHRHIGPAVHSGNSLFLYGPSGNGKTTIAQKIAGLIAGMDPIWIPYALTAGGQIIQIHDRLYHTPVSSDESPFSDRPDGRWGNFKRPSVEVGGELKMDALDLRFDPISKSYEAPLQIKANGGMFLIDDFGRQQVSPSDLLNRWIVPLESGIDYLRLRTGQTIVIPFRQLIVFSTNLDPYQLADDAFFRRIQMKVGVFSPNEERFRTIFTIMCEQMGIPFEEESFDYLVQKWYHQSGRVMQSVHPRDLLKIVDALCKYEGYPSALTPERVEEACKSYFVDPVGAVSI